MPRTSHWRRRNSPRSTCSGRLAVALPVTIVRRCLRDPHLPGDGARTRLRPVPTRPGDVPRGDRGADLRALGLGRGRLLPEPPTPGPSAWPRPGTRPCASTCPRPATAAACRRTPARVDSWLAAVDGAAAWLRERRRCRRGSPCSDSASAVCWRGRRRPSARRSRSWCSGRRPAMGQRLRARDPGLLPATGLESGRRTRRRRRGGAGGRDRGRRLRPQRRDDRALCGRWSPTTRGPPRCGERCCSTATASPSRSGCGRGWSRPGSRSALASGDGWGRMVAHPERIAAARGDRRRGRGLARRRAGGGDRPGACRRRPPAEVAPAPAPERSSGSSSGAGGARDPAGRSSSPSAVPSASSPSPSTGRCDDICVVFLNAGAVRHIGPNRIWVESRAALGGARGADAAGRPRGDRRGRRRRELASRTSPSSTSRSSSGQVEAVLDALEERGGVERFLLVGLCASGYWSYRTALNDRRVAAAILLNAGALAWHSDLLADRAGRKLGRVCAGAGGGS